MILDGRNQITYPSLFVFLSTQLFSRFLHDRIHYWQSCWFLFQSYCLLTINSAAHNADFHAILPWSNEKQSGLNKFIFELTETGTSFFVCYIIAFEFLQLYSSVAIQIYLFWVYAIKSFNAFNGFYGGIVKSLIILLFVKLIMDCNYLRLFANMAFIK